MSDSEVPLSLPPPGPYRGIRSIRDLAAWLNISCEELYRWSYREGVDQRYITFEIPKRTGGHSTIAAPKAPLKAIQRALYEFLSPIARLDPACHGFKADRSIVTNAFPHVGKRVVLKVDIKDFFPSISRKRIHRIFMRSPYNFPSNVAYLIAGICTYQGSLPQGSPISPFIANLAMRYADNKLRHLSKRFQITYTRYADDLTFSTTRGSFPSVLMEKHRRLGEESIANILHSKGWVIHEGKTRQLSSKNRMLVTGVVLNVKPNVPREYIRAIRRLIHLAHRDGVSETAKYFFENLDSKGRKGDEKLFKAIVRGRIAHVAHIRGKNDPLARKLLRSWYTVVEPNRQLFVHPLSDQYDQLVNEQNLQRRGYLLEALVGAICRHESITFIEPFRAVGEQVDGAIEIDNTLMLVECKYTKSQSGLRELDALYGKLGRRPKDCWGLFISMAGLSKEAEVGMKEYSNKKLIILTKTDLDSVFSCEQEFRSLIQLRKRERLLRRITFIDRN